jgi:hypothetical protein
MKFSVAFFFSKAESELGFRFWKWKWRLHLDEKFNFKDKFKDTLFKLENKKSKSDNQSKDDSQPKARVSKFLLKALLYPETRNRIWQFVKKLVCRAYNLFSVKFENIEVRGTLGDPFYDSVALGISRGCYCPNWENENGNWSAKGEIILRTGFFRGAPFLFGSIYETAALAFILWRGLRRAKKAAR